MPLFANGQQAPQEAASSRGDPSRTPWAAMTVMPPPFEEALVEPSRLTPDSGWHEVTISHSMELFVDVHRCATHCVTSARPLWSFGHTAACMPCLLHATARAVRSPAPHGHHSSVDKPFTVSLRRLPDGQALSVISINEDSRIQQLSLKPPECIHIRNASGDKLHAVICECRQGFPLARALLIGLRLIGSGPSGTADALMNCHPVCCLLRLPRPADHPPAHFKRPLPLVVS